MRHVVTGELPHQLPCDILCLTYLPVHLEDPSNYNTRQHGAVCLVPKKVMGKEIEYVHVPECRYAVNSCQMDVTSWFRNILLLNLLLQIHGVK